MISYERGINFNEIQGSLKGLNFDSILESFWSPLVSFLGPQSDLFAFVVTFLRYVVEVIF